MAESPQPRLRGSDVVTETSAVLVPRAATMDGFAATAAAAGGISLRDLDPLTTLLVRTCNSRYCIVIS